MARSFLVLDTPVGDLTELANALRSAPGLPADCRVDTVASTDAMLAKLTAGLPYDLVVVDYLLGDGRYTGPQVLALLRDTDVNVPVVAVAERGDVALASEAVKAGATDFLVRLPGGEAGQLQERVGTLLAKITRLLDLMDRNRALREQNSLLQGAASSRYRIVGESPAILAVIERIRRVADIPRPVLILGERGTGKELVARAIHDASGSSGSRGGKGSVGSRSAEPFVVVNCAAFPDTLLESELFGHEKGSFTGADHVAHGRFEQADGGTLFLDEIAHMSLPFQQKILRVVEYGTFTRVGGQTEISSSARIVAASNVNLQGLISQGRFLPDLYDRLAFEVITVPPLRDRPGDIELLARHFLAEFTREIPALGGKRLSRQTLETLARYPFPGNARELKNIIERAAYREAHLPGDEIAPADLGLSPQDESATNRDAGAAGPAAAAGTAGSAVVSSGEPSGTDFEARVEAFRRAMVLDALRQAGGNQAQAARLLGLTYHQFRHYYRKYGVASGKTPG